MSKFCTNCGNQLSDEMMFCPKCGNKCEPVIAEPNSINTADTSSSSNSGKIPEIVDVVKSAPKIKPKKKLNVRLAMSVSILAVVVVVGIISIICLFSSGRPSVVELDKDTKAFDLTFEEFKSGFSKSIKPVFKAMDYENQSSDFTLDEYKAEFTNEDNWYSWDEDENVYHKWTYKYSDSLSYEISVQVDKDSNKIKSINSTSYSPDIITKMILTSYIFYGYKDIDNNFESIYNLSIFLDDVVEESNYILDIDGVDVLSIESEDYNPTYYYFPLSDEDKDSYSGEIINLNYDDLAHFDKALSSRYGIDYEWQKVPDEN